MPGGLISAVTHRSLARRVGLRPGDELVTINGHPLRDVIDVRFHAAEEHLLFGVRRGGETLTLETGRRYGEELGIEFARPLFDGVRRCNNGCAFCFVAQSPPGLRRSLYVKDDDYRTSFLHGSYVTLTNLRERDWERIGGQHLSPLYVSVHATDPDLRRRVLRNPSAPDVMAQLRRLAALGVEVHTQIVVVPGLDDGVHLDRSIGDLAGLYPAVRSLSVVPVGLTRFHQGGCRLPTRAEARAVFDRVASWQARLRGELGAGFAYLSDEWFLRLGEEVPPAEAYDGLDLTENGVGLVRGFLDAGDWKLDAGSWMRGARRPTVVTGTLFAPLLRRVLGGADVVEVVNRFFGETVTVAGLLTGQDVVAQLAGRELGDVVALPAAMFGGPGRRSLDGMQLQEVAKALGRRVVVG